MITINDFDVAAKEK